MVYIHVLTIVELIGPCFKTYQNLWWALFMYLFVLLLFSISVCLFIYIIWLTGTKDFIITKKWNCTRCFGLGLLQTQRRLKHHVQFHFFVIINIFGVTLIRSTKYKYLLNQQPKDSLSNAINDNFSFKILVHCVSRHISPLVQKASYLALHSSLFEPDGAVNYDYIAALTTIVTKLQTHKTVIYDINLNMKTLSKCVPGASSTSGYSPSHTLRQLTLRIHPCTIISATRF